MLDDELVDYISQVKSPFEEEGVTQEELEYRGYLRYCQDCILKSIGTNECFTQIDLYWSELKEKLDQSELDQFMNIALSNIVKAYKMSFLSNLIIQKEIDSLDYNIKEKLFLFLEHNKWKKYFVNCLSTIDASLIRNESKLKVFLDADYDSFVAKFCNYKTVHPWLREYFSNCARNEGTETLYLILKKDLFGIIVEQNLKNKKEIKQ